MRSGAEWTRQTGLWKRWLAVVLAAVVTAGAAPVNFLGVSAAEGTAVENDMVLEAEEEKDVPKESDIPAQPSEAEPGEELRKEETAEELSEEEAGKELHKEEAAEEWAGEELSEEEAAEEWAGEELSEEEAAEEPREEEAIEEPAGNEAASLRTGADSISIEEIASLAESITDGDKLLLSASEDQTYYYKYVPSRNYHWILRSYAAVNASLRAYLYDAEGNLITESQEIDDRNFECHAELRIREVYYFQVDLSAEDPEQGGGTAKILFAPGDSYGFFCQIVGQHEKTGLVNSEMTLSVKAASPTELSYQWFIYDEAIEGATSASYTFLVDQTAEYWCHVTDELGNEGRYNYHVRADNRLTIQPEGGESGISETALHVEPGEQTRMRVIASAIDDSQITYKWFRYIETEDMWSTHWHTELIEGETEDTFVLESPKTGEAYICNVSDRCGSSQELRFNIFVDNDLTVYAKEAGSTSVNITVAPGEALHLNVLASAKDESRLVYQWYRENELMEETQENSYEPAVPQSAKYKCTVRDQYGNSSTVDFTVLVENELAVYAGGTREARDDIYAFQGEPVVMNVDVSAIDDSEMKYVWRRRVHRWNAYYDWYNWDVINGENGPECVVGSAEEGDQFSCEVTDRYGNSAVIEFEVHIVEDDMNLTVRLTDPSGNTIEDGFTVSWYSADGVALGVGARLHNVTPQTQYECRITLEEELSYRYVQPEPALYTSGENSESFDFMLTEIEPVTVSGTVSSKKGERISGANVRLKQVYNGQYTKILDAETDENGAFSFDAFKTKATLIISVDEYYDGYFSVAAEPGEEAVSIDAVLEEIPTNRITLKLYRINAVSEGDEALTEELSNANGLLFSVRDLTKMSDITEFKVQFPYIVLGEGTADPGDTIRISAEDDQAGMTADPVDVTLDNAGCAEAEWTFLQNGKISIRNIIGNDENVVFVFDENGQCLQSGSVSASFNSDPLPDGKYSCVLMEKTNVLRSVDTFARLAEFGLAEGTDYIKLEASVSKGVITQINGAAVPKLSLSTLVYTVEGTTRFWANRMETVTGQYVQMRLSYEINEEYASANETVTLEVPDGMTFVERSLTLDGRACGCLITDHDGAQTVTIPVNSRKSILRFYILPTNSGNKRVFAYLSFSDGQTERKQPVGSLPISVSAARIRVPERTGQKTITVTGQTLADCRITVYDNGTAVGTTTSRKSGTWELTFDLVAPHKYSYHTIYASVVSTEYGVDIETDAAELFYNCNYAELSKVTMINTAHPAGNLTPTEYRTVFDFLHPDTAVPVYRYWPQYPAFTFVVEFVNDSAGAVSDVCVITTNSSGDKTRIACEYDEEDGVWVGTHNYPSASDTPCKVGVSCNNDSDSIYDFSIDGEEMEDPEYHKASDLEALIDETAEIENEEYTDGKLSYDVIVKGRKIGRYSLEIYDYHTFDVDDWKNGHEAVTFAEDGNTCFSSFESSGNTITSYVIDPYKELAVCASFEAASGFDAAARSVSGSREVKKTSSAQDTIFGMLLKWIGAEQALEETFKFPYYYIEKDALEHEVDIINNFCTCAVGKDLNAETVLKANLELSLFKTNFWSPIAIGIIIDQILIIGSDAINTDFFNLGPDIETVVASLMSGKESVYKNEYQRRLENIKGYQKKLKKCHICDDSSSTWCNCRNHELTRDTNQIIDPSGYVYEAVPSNRVSGVKAEAYYYDYAVDEFGVQEDEKSEILWDAENYDQVNPQYTDADGTFGWDVPEGQWLVKFSKEGYEDTDSRQDVAVDEDGYLPVPPIQTEVNTAIVSKAAPEVSSIAAYPDEIRIEFSQYMQIGSVSAANVGVTSGGKTVPGTIKALNAEENYEKTEQFASYFAFVPDKELSGTVKVNVSGVKNYCGNAMAGSYSKDHDVKIMPKELEIIGSRNILYHGSAELTIRVVPSEAGAGRTITVASYSPSIVAVQEQKITADRNGTAKVVLNGNLPGQGILSVSLDGTRLSEEITATVGTTQSSVSLEEGGYSVKLADDAVPYSGRPITPAVTVDGLTEGTDFSVSYKNNTDPGTATVTVTGMGSYTGTITGTFLILPGKTSRGDMFNLANNVKVTWTEVPGANYYKVYREGITDKKESLTEPVIVTTGLVGWDSQAGLTNGHAYRYKIVASLTGKGDPSGDSRLSYSKMMYRLKTTAWKYVKNTAPGKVTASYQKSASGDSYVILYADNEDMTGAKSKVIFGADTTSAVLGGFRKGKTYWFQIRVRKKVNGIDYYTTFGVKKPVRITR